MRTKEEVYLTLAKRWAKGTAILFAVGASMLFPSYYYLFRIFKGETAFTALSRKDDEPLREKGAESSRQ